MDEGADRARTGSSSGHASTATSSEGSGRSGAAAEAGSSGPNSPHPSGPIAAPDESPDTAGSGTSASGSGSGADADGDDRTTVLPRQGGRRDGGPGVDEPTTHLPRARGGRSGGRAPGGGFRAGLMGPGGMLGPRRPPPGARPPGPARPPQRSGPVPGMVLVDRYRLVAEVGQDRGAEAVLWKARDTMLDRDVAVTVLAGSWQSDARAHSAVSRATRAAQFEHPNVARVLDVVPPGSNRLPPGITGAAVAEWTPGRDLCGLVSRGALRPSDTLRVVEPLAAAVAAAHQDGLVLGLEHPQRVRVGPHAAARIAFPMPRGDAEVADDVHGLGAALYLLLTARWPSHDGTTPAGLKAAPRTDDGAPVSVRELRPDLPVDLAALVDRTLDRHGGIRTASAVHRLIARLGEQREGDRALLPLAEEGVALDEDSSVWREDDAPEPPPDPATRRKLRVGMSLVVLAVVAALAVTAFWVISAIGLGGKTAPPLVVPTGPPTPAAAAPPRGPAPPAPAPPPAAGPAQLASVAVYDPSGSPDNPNQVNRAVDNNPGTAWSTSDYQQQLPALKPGIGIMTSLAGPTPVGSVTVRSSSPGTHVEIRAAAAPNIPLNQTQLLGAGTVSGDQLVIPVQPAPPTGNLLVWITTLGQGKNGYSTTISEISVQRAG